MISKIFRVIIYSVTCLGLKTNIGISPYQFKPSIRIHTDLTLIEPRQARILVTAWHNKLMVDFNEGAHDLVGPDRIESLENHPLRHIMKTINIMHGTFNAYDELTESGGIRYYAWQPIHMNNNTVRGSPQCLLCIIDKNNEWSLLTVVQSPYWSAYNIKPGYLLYALKDLAKRKKRKLLLDTFYAINDNIRFKLDWDSFFSLSK